MQQVAQSAISEYLLRADDDAQTEELAAAGATKFAVLLRRLGE